MGSEIKHDPNERIKIGSTAKGEILSIFGPPDRIQKQYDGDIFVYAYLRKNSSTFTLEEPYFTNFVIFQFTRVQQKKDGLVILFDKDGVVKNFGFQKGTQELTTFWSITIIKRKIDKIAIWGRVIPLVDTSQLTEIIIIS